MSTLWTPQDDSRLLFYVGLEPPVAIAARLVRTERAVLTRYYREYGGTLMKATARVDGMSVTECADALGVHRQRVQKWISRGWLKASKRKIQKRFIFAINADNLDTFIRDRGGLLGDLHPVPIWRDVVESARRDLRARLICRAELAPIFGLTIQMFNSGKGPGKAGFPAPAFTLSGGECWYERGAVREWLRMAPERYRTARVLRAFGLEA